MSDSDKLLRQAAATLDARPVIRVLLTLSDGGQIHRLWTWQDVKDGSPDIDQSDWMVTPRKTWPHPQEPITFEAGVAHGREDEAREWLAALTSVGHRGAT